MPMTDTAKTPAHMGKSLGNNICNVAFVVHEWEAKVGVRDKDLQQEIKTDQGYFEPVKNENTTGTRRKIDGFQGVKDLVANGRKITTVIDQFSVRRGKMTRGIRLISTLMVGPFSVEMSKLLEERMVLARTLRDDWDAYLLYVEQTFPNQFGQIHKQLPDPNTLEARYGVEWEFQPLNPIRGEDLDLVNLSREEQAEVIGRVNNMAEKRAEEAFGMVIENVFGEVVDICDEVLGGSLTTGKKRQGSIDKLLRTLDRVLNFRHLANEAVLQQVESVKGTLESISAESLNSDVNLQAAVQAVFRPLKREVQQLSSELAESSNRGRDINYG